MSEVEKIEQEIREVTQQYKEKKISAKEAVSVRHDLLERLAVAKRKKKK